MFLALAVGAVVVIGFFLYNSLIGKKNQVENAMGGLDAQLKQRYDLIPNLVASVKQYMQHESSVLEKIVELRGQAMKKDLGMEDKQELNKAISKGLAGIMIQAEQYPELKANTGFQDFQKTLYEVEQNIAASRRFYNAAVTDFNNGVEMFPTNFFAKMMNLTRKEVFNIPEVERKNVSVQNLFDGKAS